jgi:outer membrane protein assembly factor BamB
MRASVRVPVVVLIAVLAPCVVSSQVSRPPSEELPEVQEEQQDESPAEAPKIAPPPDGILPVAKIAGLDYGPRDRPVVEIAGGRLIVTTASGLVENHDALSGELAWKLGLPNETFFPPLVLRSDPFELLLASPSGHAVRVGGRNGEILQELTLGSPSAVVPLVADGLVIVGATNGEVLAYEMESGSERFRVETGETPAALAIDKGLVVVSGSEGTLTAIDLDPGKVRWTFRGRSGFFAPAAFAEKGDKVYVGDDAGDFYCLGAEDGKIHFRWATGAAIRNRPLVEGNRVYVASYGNNLYDYDANGGAEQWRVSLPGRPASPAIRVYHRLLVFTFDGVIVEVDPEHGRIGKSWTAPGEVASSPAVLVATPRASITEEPTAVESSATEEEIPGKTTTPKAPQWFEDHRIILSLRSGQVLVLGYKPPEAKPKAPGPAEEKVMKKPPPKTPGPETSGGDTLSMKEDVSGQEIHRFQPSGVGTEPASSNVKFRRF